MGRLQAQKPSLLIDFNVVLLNPNPNRALYRREDPSSVNHIALEVQDVWKKVGLCGLGTAGLARVKVKRFAICVGCHPYSLLHAAKWG